jgi:outer membrane receptor protein involved in Fe transport
MSRSVTRRLAAKNFSLSLLAQAALAALSTPYVWAQTTTPLPKVEVIRVTPVPGLGVPKDQIPGNVQTASDQKLRDAQSLNLPDFLGGQMPSVTINEIQGNPYQLDVNYRGFSASPLLGTPQGLSVFLDGVRVNEPFGDVVNWDLIPRGALANITLMPGSNPLFGLNTLGGALSLQTKNGLTHPGTEAELSAGSFGRVSVDVSHGQKLGESSHLFLAASHFKEDGWRDFSPSRVQQLFGKVGGNGGPLTWDLSAAYGKTRMTGNGATPESMLAQRREQVYTTPDTTRNDALLLTLQTGWKLSETQSLSGTAYVRRVDTKTLNGDLNDAYDPPTVTEAGVENRTESKQRGEGLALQWNLQDATHKLAVGVSYDRSRTNFQQTEAEGDLDANRGVVPTEDAEVDALLRGKTATTSLFATDTWALSPDMHLTLSGRYNRTRVQTIDDGRATLGLPTALDNDYRYTKFNPAVGMTFKLSPAMTAYGGVSQGNRAPSPIELGCSDPNNACVLPNALQSDPPLNQVVSRTVELGLRGSAGGMRWNVSGFSTRNRDDILFVSNQLAAGYFTNFGRTQRQGLELDASGAAGVFDWAVAYSFLKATYESSACIVSPSNSSAETSAACPGNDEIEVRPGDRIPGLPRRSLKLNLGVRPIESLRVGAQLAAFSGQYVRGNENNRHAPDGVDFFGSGALPRYALLNLTGEWRFAPGWELFGRINNVLNKKYASGGLLAENAFDANGVVQAPADWRNEQFVTPGAPRAAWVGVRWTFGESKN